MPDDSPHSVTIWLDRLKAGDTDAAERIWNRFSTEMMRHARRKLDDLPRAAQDEEDVALSAFHSFCQAVAADRFPELDDRDDVRTILIMHTLRKALSMRRRHLASKRNPGPTIQQLVEEVAGSEPDPQLAVLMQEEARILFESLGDEELTLIAADRLDGYANDEIAARRDCSLRTVERKLMLIRKIWAERAARPDSG